jgi:hypothetical protein
MWKKGNDEEEEEEDTDFGGVWCVGWYRSRLHL